MVNIYHEKDADLSILKNEVVAVIGYGNQGRSQALNMRDSGLKVIVGNIKDRSFNQSMEDGFETYLIPEAVKKASIVLILLPDEVQPYVYKDSIEPNLDKGDAIVFAHGYNIHYGFLKPREDIDVLMVAPRMVGKFVRELYESGSGAPVFFYAHSDATGRAKDRVLALCKAIGATRVGAMEITVAEETELDHFSEHFIAPVISRALILSYEVLTELGYTPEAVLLETYMSGELGEVASSLAKDGLVTQLPFHSRTSQYGQLIYADVVMPDEYKNLIRDIVKEIQTAEFARDWKLEQLLGYPKFNKLLKQAFEHPINQAEKKLREQVRIKFE
jgi:ketol-acid reductoisomerase